MELPVVQIQDNKALTSSLKVAEYFGKRHKHVLRDIEQTLLGLPKSGPSSEGSFGRLNFEESSYINTQNKKQPCYLLTKDGFLLLTMGYTGEKAMKLKVAYINQFNKMEEALNRKRFGYNSELLQLFVTPEMRPWVKTFPDEFFEQMYRLLGWHYEPHNRQHPQYLGKLINELVYDCLLPDIREHLNSLNPSDHLGNRQAKHHQFITADFGLAALRSHIDMVLGWARQCRDIQTLRNIVANHRAHKFQKIEATQVPLFRLSYSVA